MVAFSYLLSPWSPALKQYLDELADGTSTPEPLLVLAPIVFALGVLSFAGAPLSSFIGQWVSAPALDFAFDGCAIAVGASLPVFLMSQPFSAALGNYAEFSTVMIGAALTLHLCRVAVSDVAPSVTSDFQKRVIRICAVAALAGWLIVTWQYAG